MNLMVLMFVYIIYSPLSLFILYFTLCHRANLFVRCIFICGYMTFFVYKLCLGWWVISLSLITYVLISIELFYTSHTLSYKGLYSLLFGLNPGFILKAIIVNFFPRVTWMEICLVNTHTTSSYFFFFISYMLIIL